MSLSRLSATRAATRLATLAILAAMVVSACAPAAPASPTAAPAKPAESKPAATAAPAKPAESKPAEAAKPAESKPTAAAAAKPAEAAKPAAKPAAKQGGTAVIGVAQEPTTLLWPEQGTPFSFSLQAIAVLCEPMIRIDKDGKFQSGVFEVPTVENGGISADGKTFRLKMVPNVKWDDGQPVTMKDFEFTWKWILNPESLAVTTQGWDKIDSVQIGADGLSATVQLKESYVPFVAQTMAGWYLIPQHALTAKGKDGYARAPVCNGPFKFVEWISGDHLTFERSPTYFKGPANLDRVILKIVPDRNTRMAQARTGDIDVVTDLTEAQIPEVRGQQNLTLVTWNPAAYERILINFHEPDDLTKPHPLLSDLNVRKAINLAVDKQTINDKVFFGLTTIAINELDNTPWANKALKPYPYDPDEAKRLLDAAGWVPGPDGIRVKNGVRAEATASTTAGNQTRSSIQALVQQNLKDVGIDMKIENYPPPKFFADWDRGGVLYRRAANLLQFYNGLQGVDPDLAYWWHSREIATAERKAGSNRAGFSNAELDQLLDERVRTVDPARQRAILDRAQQIIYDGYPMIPLVNRALIATFSKRLNNYQMIDALANAGLVDNIAEWTKE